MIVSLSVLISLSRKGFKSTITQRNIFTELRRASSYTKLYCNSTVNKGLLLSSSSVKAFSTDANDVHQGLLKYKEGPYSSVQISISDYTVEDSSEFATRLYETITHLKNEKKNSIMINFPILHSHLIPIAGMYGFKFHHAEGDSSSMLLWLASSENRVPPFATHHVGDSLMLRNIVLFCYRLDHIDRNANCCGVAGLVTHKNKLLVVKEINKVAGWKFPGGYANLGEDIDKASMREVLEETGIQTKYCNVIAFRHSHNVQFGRSDLYFICRLEALNFDIQQCEHEIDEAQWMDINECLKQTAHPMTKAILTQIIDTNGNIIPPTIAGSGLNESMMNSILKGKAPFKFYNMPSK